ncbi:MAG: hypothetical protein M3R24_04715 [Chloroflexota bacterium]|nr:hypothetical protein [Chloroflexota bacterium]
MHTDNTQHNMRAGDHDGARSILFQQALREDSNRETDWLWLAQQDLSEHEQQYSLRRALYINPHSRQDLDSQTAQQVLRLLRALADAEGMTIVIATHDLEAAQLATVGYHVQDGLLASVELCGAAFPIGRPAACVLDANGELAPGIDR